MIAASEQPPAKTQRLDDGSKKEVVLLPSSSPWEVHKTFLTTLPAILPQRQSIAAAAASTEAASTATAGNGRAPGGALSRDTGSSGSHTLVPLPLSGIAGNAVVFLDVMIRGERLPRMHFELYSHVVPRSAENVRQFCTGETTYGAANLPRGYKLAPFHRCMRGYYVQGGDFVNKDGTGTASIFPGRDRFEAENYDVPQDDEGTLSLVTAAAVPSTSSAPPTGGGGDLLTYGCQFIISFRPLPLLQRKIVGVGKIVGDRSGLHKLRDALQTMNVLKDGRPADEIVVAECGEM